MKISCPVCNASYMVPDTAIKPEGRQVKCASCGHGWLQKPASEPSDAPTTDIKAPKKPAKVPAVRKLDPVPMPVKAVAIILIIGAYFMQNFHSFNDTLGIVPTDGLAFGELVAKVERQENRLVTVLQGVVKNETEDQTIQLPKHITMKLWSGQKRVMAETTYQIPDKTELAPGETVAIAPKVGNISGSAKHLVVDIGNGMELFFRE